MIQRQCGRACERTHARLTSHAVAVPWSQAADQHGSSAACVSSRTRGHAGVESSIGSAGSYHYEGGSAASPPARGIVMDNAGDEHAAILPQGVESSAAGVAPLAPQVVSSPSPPLRPSHANGCKCAGCKEWRRLEWRLRTDQAAPALPAGRFAHEGGLVSKNDAVLRPRRSEVRAAADGR